MGAAEVTPSAPTIEMPSVAITSTPVVNETPTPAEQTPIPNNIPLTPEQPSVSAEQTFSTAPAPTETPVQMPNDGAMTNEPNPQAEKLAVVSDPSLNSAGLNLQPNVARKNSAGNANTKYIVIGTVCLVLAIAVVVAAYFVIKNMK